MQQYLESRGQKVKNDFRSILGPSGNFWNSMFSFWDLGFCCQWPTWQLVNNKLFHMAGKILFFIKSHLIFSTWWIFWRSSCFEWSRFSSRPNSLFGLVGPLVAWAILGPWKKLWESKYSFKRWTSMRWEFMLRPMSIRK